MGEDEGHKNYGHEDHDGDDGPQTPPAPPVPPGPPISPLDISPAAVAAHNADVDRLATLPEADLRRVLRIGLGPLNPHSKNVTEWMIAAI